MRRVAARWLATVGGRGENSLGRGGNSLNAEDAEGSPEDAEDFLKKASDGLLGAMNNSNGTLSGVVVDAAMKVHSALGPGLLEGAYEACLAHELRNRGLNVQTQVPVPLVYHGLKVDLVAYRADLLVDHLLLVELKSVTKLLPVHEAQLVSYLRMGGYRIGLLINFSSLHLRDGIKRKVNTP